MTANAINAVEIGSRTNALITAAVPATESAITNVGKYFLLSIKDAGRGQDSRQGDTRRLDQCPARHYHRRTRARAHHDISMLTPADRGAGSRLQQSLYS